MTITISIVPVSVWIISIIDSNALIEWVNIVFVEWFALFAFIGNLSVDTDICKDWTCRVSMFVSSGMLSCLGIVTGMSLSYDPGKFFPDSVLCGDQGNLVDVTSSFITFFLYILPVTKSSFYLLTRIDKVVNQTSSCGIKFGLSIKIVSRKSSLFTGKGCHEGIDSC